MVNDKIPVAAIDDNEQDRLRKIDWDHAEVIKTSIMQRGLLQPIRVRPVGEGRYQLVAGAHRLAALKSLGRVALKIGEEVLIAEASDYAAKVDEIDENLARHELNALDRAIFLARRKEFYLLANPDAVRGGDRRSLKAQEKIKGSIWAFDPKGFGIQASKKLGMSKQAIERSIKLIGDLQSETVELLRGTRAARNQSELIAISKLDPEQQIAVAKLLREGEAKTSHQAKIALSISPAAEKDPPGEKLVADILAGFPKLSKDQQERVLNGLNLARRPAKGGGK